MGSDRADAMFNSILHAVLPIVRNAIGAKLVDENIGGWPQGHAISSRWCGATAARAQRRTR